MPSVDELQAMVEKIQHFRQQVPEAQKHARRSVWLARFSMFIALVVVVFNVVALDLPLLVLISSFLCAGTFLHAAHTLIKAEAWRTNLKQMADESASDLKRATAMLEYAQAQATTDERPAP